MALQWRHNGRDSVSNHQPHDCLLNRLFRRRSKKTSKLRVTGFCAGNSPGTDESPAQMASCAENVSIWWRHHGVLRDAYITNIRELRDYNKNNPRFMKWYHSMFRDFLTALAHIGGHRVSANVSMRSYTMVYTAHTWLGSLTQNQCHACF